MRMKWKKILAVIAIPVAIAAGTYAYEPPAELIEYHVEADRGDTIWSLCARVASDRDDLSELVFETMRENNISQPGDLQPGQLIIIHVKEVK